MVPLTVFTPAYNRADLLGRCFESMKRQTNKNFIWLIMDDGSADNTRQVVESWLREPLDFTLRYIYKENGGLHTAYNEAIANIDTELCVCIDSDDYMPDDAVEKILPVYDNLSRALKQETADAAFKKGVEMTMTELVKILSGLGVEIFGEVGEEFDPNIHNAVMHIEDDTLGENVICQVFQQGFKMGDKVIRFAMVQVAN